MSEQVCDPPIQATVESFSMTDMVGKLALADGRVAKFGGSALRDFERPPEVQGTVFVHALQEHPRLGLRAKLVKKTATTEVERLDEEQRIAEEEQAQQKAHEEAWHDFRGQFPPSPLAQDWVPSIDYECPALATIPRSIDSLDIEKMNDGLERIMELLDQTTPGEFIPSLKGKSVPWNQFWDPMSWPIGDDGGGNLVCVHLAPYFYGNHPAPVTFWFHELSREWFLADDLETFLRETQALGTGIDQAQQIEALPLIDGRPLNVDLEVSSLRPGREPHQIERDHDSADSPFLSKMSGAEKAGWDDEGDWSWLWPGGFGEKPANMSPQFYAERSLISDISKALNDEPRVGEKDTQMAAYREAFYKLLEVERIYEANGWSAPLSHLRFQRRRIFR